MAAREQRVDHVAAVELADGQQVQRGDEQPEPSGERDRIEIDVDGRRIDAQNQVREAEEQERVAELEAAGGFVQRGHVGELEADDDGGNREHHSCPRAGGADIEHHAAVRAGSRIRMNAPKVPMMKSDGGAGMK